MTDLNNAPISAASGQDAGTAPVTEAAPSASPEAPEGQAKEIKAEGQAKAPEVTAEQIEKFLSLDDVPEELRPHLEGLLAKKEKEMQAAFTRKTQAIATDRQKIELIKQFEANPAEMIKKIAPNYGLTVSPAYNAPQQGEQYQNPGQQPVDWNNYEPQTWNELRSNIKEDTINEVLEKLSPILQPLIQTLGETKSQAIEQQLGQIDSNWKIYEDDIKANMAYIKPELLKTPDGIAKLYRMSVPQDVLDERATQIALKKYQDKAKSAAIDSNSKSKNTTTPPLSGKLSWNEAYQEAKRRVGNQ
jgi:hypothetical protein